MDFPLEREALEAYCRKIKDVVDRLPLAKLEMDDNDLISGIDFTLNAKKYINNESSLVIYNIDTYFESTRLKSKLLTIKNTNIDGLLGAINSNDGKLSFIELDSEFVKRTKEKE